MSASEDEKPLASPEVDLSSSEPRTTMSVKTLGELVLSKMGLKRTSSFPTVLTIRPFATCRTIQFDVQMVNLF